MNGQILFRLIFMLVGLLSATSIMADDRGAIYLYGTLSGFQDPIEGNEAAYENARIFETSPGSRIYEGVVSTSSSRVTVRLHTALAPAEASYNAQCYNIIAPADETSSELQSQGSSGVITASVRDEEKFIRNLPQMYFTFSNDGGASSYRINLNLNNNRLTIVPDYAVVALVNDESVPTIENAGQYESIKNSKKRYIDGGVLKFRFYDYFNQTWIGAPDGSAITTVDGENKISGQQGSDRFFTVSDWHGGTVAFEGAGADNIVLNLVKNIETDVLYAIGDFNWWGSLDLLGGVKDPESDGCVFIFDLPVVSGENQFKLTTEKSWDGVNFGSSGYMWKDDDGYLTLGIGPNPAYYNISFYTDKPVGSTIKIKANVTTRELTFVDDAAEITASGCAFENKSIFVSFTGDYEPWLGAPYPVANGVQKLYEESPDVYSGYIDVPDGRFNFNFISELAPQGSHNTVIGPSTKDREVYFEGYVYSNPAAVFTDGSAGRWTLERWPGGSIKAIVDMSCSPIKVTFVDVRWANDEMFFVGQPEGWAGPTEANREHYELWRLQPTTKGYYGAFDVAAGEAMFRFYNGLTGWDQDSYGCQVDDEPIEYSIASGEYRGEYVRGKGSWSFPDWPGGTMYVFVSRNSNKVHFSNRPISGVGYPFDNPEIENGVYAFSDGGYSTFRECAPGVYRGCIWSGSALWLFTRISGYSTDDKEWAGSYAISAPSADCVLEFDELGVAESSYFTRDGVNTDGAYPFYLPEIFDTNSVYVMVTVDTNNNKIYFDNMSTVYLVGTLTGDNIPTYATRSDYRSAALDKWHQTGIIDAPAGDFTFAYYELGREELETAVKEITFDGALAEGADINYGFARNKCVIKGWKGGKLLITPNYIMDLEQLHSINVWNDGTSQALQETSAGSHIYKGEMTLKSATDKTLSFKLHEGLDWRENVSVGSQSLIHRDAYQWVYAYHSDRIKYFPDGGTVKSGAAVGGEAFYLPELKDENVKVNLTVDLNEMTVEISVDQSALGKTYSVLMEDEISDYVLEPSVDDTSKSVASFYLGSGDYSFNIVGNDDEVIVPAGGDALVVFDQYGMWEGDYSTVSLPSDTKAQKAAPSMGKWSVTMPDYGYLSILMDRATKKIKIVSSSASKTYYTAKADVDGGEIIGEYPTIDNIESLKSAMLTSTDGVVYSGLLSLDENVTSSAFYLFAGLPVDRYHSISTVIGPRFSSNLVDLSESSATVLTDVPDYNNIHWVVSHPQGVKYIRLDYDTYLHQLSLSCTNSGVEDVLASGGCEIAALQGCVRVTAETDMRLTIYSLQGFVVKDVTVHAGVSYIELPSGLYIANGQKLWVR